MKAMLAVAAVVICAVLPPVAHAEERIELRVRDVMLNEVLLYPAGTARAAVLVHQSGATMESWRDFATTLNERGISALSLSTVTPHDVEAAVRFLKDGNHDDIILIGASIGGGAIMQALAKGDWPSVRKIVLLAPSSGPALTSGEVPKLFMVARADFFKSGTYSAFDKASDPKTLVEYEGRDHGQQLLDGDHGAEALREALAFIDR